MEYGGASCPNQQRSTEVDQQVGPSLLVRHGGLKFGIRSKNLNLSNNWCLGTTTP